MKGGYSFRSFNHNREFVDCRRSLFANVELSFRNKNLFVRVSIMLFPIDVQHEYKGFGKRGRQMLGSVHLKGVIQYLQLYEDQHMDI